MERGTKNTILAVSLAIGVSGGVSLTVKKYMQTRFDKIDSILGEMNIDQTQTIMHLREMNIDQTQTIMHLRQTNINFEESSRRIGGLIDILNKK